MSDHPRPAKRPWMVTLLALILALFALSQAVKLVFTLREWSFESTLPLTVSPLYLAIKGGLWAVVGFTTAWGLWRARAWARIASLLAGCLFAVQYGVEWLWFTAGDITRVGWPFALAVALVGLGLLAGAAFLPASRRYFRFQHHKE